MSSLQSRSQEVAAGDGGLRPAAGWVQGASSLLRRCWTAGRLRLAGWGLAVSACRGRGGEGRGHELGVGSAGAAGWTADRRGGGGGRGGLD